MKPSRSLIVIWIAVLSTAACAKSPASSPTLATEPFTQSHNGLEIQFVSAYAAGDDLLVALCYQQPSGANWVPGRHADDATITVAGQAYMVSSLDLIGFRASTESIATHRCDRLTFHIPPQPPAQVFRLTIAHMAGNTASSSDCPEVQRRLEAEAPDIKIDCMEDPQGFFSHGLLERPEGMTDQEAAYFVDDLAGEVVDGPWEFQFTVAFPDE